VKELLLRALLARDELDVVDQQEVDRAITRPELRGAVVTDRVDELVGEPFGREVRDGDSREQPRRLVTHRVQQVGLAESHPAVDEERVVGLGRQLGDRLGRGLGELVRRADHERVEGVLRIEALHRSGDGRPARRGRRRVVGRCEGVVHDDRHARLAPEHVGGGALHRVEVVLYQPVTREDVGDAHSKVVAFQSQEAAGAQPGVDDGGGELTRGGF